MKTSSKVSYPKIRTRQHLIVLPFSPDSYSEMVLSPKCFRDFLKQAFLDFPELFPPAFSQGFLMKDLYFSTKLQLYSRRILIDGQTFSVRPSFVTPYFTAFTDNVSHPLFLRKFEVPYYALTRLFGHNDMFWFRLESSLGRYSLVSTTVKSPELLPEHLCADEKIAYRQGKSLPLAMTVSGGCILGLEPSKSLDEPDLERAYGVFKSESLDVNPTYSPKTVNLDGWKASLNLWKKLFPMLLIIPCFLHLYIKLRQAATKKVEKAFHSLSAKLWNCYRAKTKRGFLQRVRNLEKWVNRVGGYYPEKLLKPLQKLINNKEEYARAYKEEEANRTSAEGDRLMQRLERHLYVTKYFKGSLESARLLVRGWALIQNFAPWNPQTVKKHHGFRSPAEQLNRKSYHSDWLHNLLISSSHHSAPSPQNPLE